MEDKKKLFQDKLDLFAKQALELSLAWGDLNGEAEDELGIVDKYPFHVDFHELAFEIDAWSESVNEPKYVKDMRKFHSHVDESITNMLDEMQEDMDSHENYNLKLEMNGKTLELFMHADLYENLNKFLTRAIEEENE